MCEFHDVVSSTCAPYFLDVCSGINAPLSRAFSAIGWQVNAIVILKGGPSHDITIRSVLKELLDWIRNNKPLLVHLGPPCSSFSQWMHMCKWWPGPGPIHGVQTSTPKKCSITCFCSRVQKSFRYVTV